MDKLLTVPQSFIAIGLQDPKSPGNVGSVMRAANCFEADCVYYSGTRYDKAKRFHTDTKNSTKHLPLVYVDDLFKHIPADALIVCVELVEGAIALNEFEHPKNAYYIFGPEDGTLNQSLIDQADSVVFIRAKSSLNLAASVNVVLYDRLSKQNPNTENDELIRMSRDTNNSVNLNL